MKEVNHIISKQLTNNLIALSKQKFSSNVIEKCLEFNTKEANRDMVYSLMKERSYYFSLLSDQYGNYVIQKCLAVAQEPQLSNFIADLRPDVEKLSQHSEFGYKIYQRLVKKYPALDASGNG